MFPVLRSPCASRFLRVVLLAGVLGLTGCAAVNMAPAIPSAANVDAWRQLAPPPIALGAFGSAPGEAARADGGHSVRGTNTISPSSGSFALQLRDQIAADLQAAGLLAEAGGVRLSAVMTANSLEVGLAEGKGRLAARFTVTRGQAVVYDREVEVVARWESSFMAAIAVPEAFNQYGALYRALSRKLIEDAEFKAAMRR